MNASTIRLFNAVQISTLNPLPHPKDITERTIRKGYLLDPHIVPTTTLLNEIESTIGYDPNAAFHKSWSFIKDTPLETLFLQQILHYITTYGFEYTNETVFIPHEQLEVPELKSDIPLRVIRGLTKPEILDKIISLGSGVALHQDTLNDLISIIQINRYNPNFVPKIKNRELKALLTDLYDLVPTEPLEFLRYLITKLTDESLLIKNDYLITKIKEADGKFLDTLLKKAPTNLSSIFLRHKPIFLALKSISRNKTYFNQLRKWANKTHKPLHPDYLNSVTAQIKFNILNTRVLQDRLKASTIQRDIRLAQALKYRELAPKSIVYRVRNGRGHATDFSWEGSVEAPLHFVEQSIVSKLKNGSPLYVPEGITYALPSTEKQFTGNFPNGTHISVPENVIVGIWWKNKDRPIDLDLSAISTSGKVGWDGSYRNEDILFSGDITSAPTGASELFHIKKEVPPYVLYVNYYNHRPGSPIPAKIFVAHDTPKNLSQNYVVDPNKIIAEAEIIVTQKQTILGLIADSGFYFANISIGTSITSGANQKQALEYLTAHVRSTIPLPNTTTKKTDDSIDLSPKTLNKTSILGLLK